MHDGARAEALRVAQTAQVRGDPSMMLKLQSAIKGIEASPQLMAKLAGNDVFGQQVRTIQASGGSEGKIPPTSQATGGTSTPTPAIGSSTVINIDHTGSASVSTPPQPQSARESQEQAKAAVIARARQQAASAGQQGSHSTDSSGFQTPPTASEDYQKKMSE
jgi:hypothetical protein